MPLAFLLTVRFALGLLYSVTVPIWESYDEDGHFAYARYLVKHRTLLQPGDPEAEKIWEKFQPPLYYLLIVPFIAGFDLGETFQRPELNPYRLGQDGGFNYAIHPDHLEGTALSISLAVQVARTVSVILSTAGAGMFYLAARRIWPAEPKTAWAAACVYAFWPQFLFTGSMVTNDALVTALAAALFYFAVRLALDGFRLGRALALGALLGAALLTKLNAIALLPVVVVALIVSLWRALSWRSPRFWLALAALGLTVTAGFWFLSSLGFVTAQILQTQTIADFVNYANSGPGGVARSRFLLLALQHALRTFLGAFGWGGPELPGWWYWVWGLAANLAVVGLSVTVVERDRSTPLNILALAICQIVSVMGLALALAIAERSVYLVWGRYLLPGLPGVAVCLIGGWRALLPGRWRTHVWKGLCLGVVLIGWSIPLVTLAPAYAKPPRLPKDAVIDYPLSVFFGEEIELLGYLQPQAVTPGKDFRIVLCWQAIAPLNRNYSVLLEIIGPDGQAYGWLETYPGRGNYPTSFWAVNAPFCDPYTLGVEKDWPAASAAYVQVSLLSNFGGEKLPVRNVAGELVGQEVRIPVQVRVVAQK
jgi:4-amino-4-deoxy-L-arabinose transferase-like glycosyltransferase